MERRMVITPGFDTADRGKHCCDLRMYVVGDKGAVTFVLYTGFDVPSARGHGCEHLFPLPADLGYHSNVPLYDGHELMSDSCEVLGGPCYYDGSTLAADAIYDLLTISGSDAVFERLEELYHARFGWDDGSNGQTND